MISGVHLVIYQQPRILHPPLRDRQVLLVLAVLGEQFASGWECVHAAFPVLGDIINTVTIKDRLTDKIFHWCGTYIDYTTCKRSNCCLYGLLAETNTKLASGAFIAQTHLNLESGSVER